MYIYLYVFVGVVVVVVGGRKKLCFLPLCHTAAAIAATTPRCCLRPWLLVQALELYQDLALPWWGEVDEGRVGRGRGEGRGVEALEPGRYTHCRADQ